MRNPSLDAAVVELNAVGIRDYVVARGGKHWQLRWAFNGQPRMLTVPCTASDWRSPHNTRSDIRRLLRLDGLLPKTNGNSTPPGESATLLAPANRRVGTPAESREPSRTAYRRTR